MINVFFNEVEVKVEQNFTLSDVLKRQGYANYAFAVAINRNFVPKPHYTTTILQEGDIIETIAPMQGG